MTMYWLLSCVIFNTFLVYSASGEANITQCQVVTGNSTGIGQYLYKIRESIFPDNQNSPCSTGDKESKCQTLECCYSQETVSTSGRPATKDNGKCTLQDWVIPTALGLVLLLVLVLLICCCCCCCSRRKKAEYDMTSA